MNKKFINLKDKNIIINKKNIIYDINEKNGLNTINSLNKSARNYGIDLLRIFAMINIIVLHNNYLRI